MSIAEVEARAIELDAPPTGLWRDALHRLARNPGAVVGGVFIAILIFSAIFAPLIANHDPTTPDYTTLKNGVPIGPSVGHWLGADTNAYDEFSRIVYGARYTLLIAVIAVAIALSLGLLIGAVAGFWGGKTDSFLCVASTSCSRSRACSSRSGWSPFWGRASGPR